MKGSTRVLKKTPQELELVSAESFQGRDVQVSVVVTIGLYSDQREQYT
jgi:hypothetical protein